MRKRNHTDAELYKICLQLKNLKPEIYKMKYSYLH